MDTVALLFGGQGGQQYVNGNFPPELIQKKLRNEVIKNYDIDLYDLLCTNESKENMSPIKAHLITYFYNLFVYEYLKNNYNFCPSFLAGHSLGEYNALVASCCINPTDCAKLIFNRGKIVENSTENGSMVALLRVTLKSCQMISKEFDLAIANINSKYEVVLAGPNSNIYAAINYFKKNNIKYVLLSVSHPFHTAYMSNTTQEYKKILNNQKIVAPTIPLVQNYSGNITSSIEEIKHNISCHMSSPVQWFSCIQTIYSEGITHFIEIAPKSVLSAHVKSANWKLNTTYINHENIFDLNFD